MGKQATPGVVMAACIFLSGVAAARGDNLVVAFTGGHAPDGNGSYRTFTDPVLNDQGQSAFKAELFGTTQSSLDDTAIFRADGAGTVVICHENWMTPDSNGRFGWVYAPAINDWGQVAFRADARNTLLGGYDAVGVYVATGGVMPTQLVRGADPAPDGNGQFFIMSGEPLLDNHGRSAFWSSFVNTSGGLEDATAVIVAEGHLLSIYARAGMPLVGGDGTFAQFNGMAKSEGDGVAFHATLRNTSKGTSNNTALFVAARMPLPWIIPVELAREGDPPPDGNGEYMSLSLNPTIDQVGWAGRTAFHAWLQNTSGGTSDDSGIFLHTMITGVGVIHIAREGQAPPDGNGQYTNFDPDIAQNDDWVAFRAWMRNTAGGSADDEAIYRGDGTTTERIVRAGQPAPGGNGVFQNVYDIAMNDPGHVAFQARLVGTAGGSSDHDGLFIGDGVHLVEVARKGDPLLGGTIAELHLATGPDCRNGLNDLSQVAYRAVLADGREVLLLYTPFVQWSGGAAGNWGTGANWTLGILPGEPYDVGILPAGSAEVAGPSHKAKVKSLTIGSTGGGMAVLNLNRGGDLAAVATVSVTLRGKILVGAGRTLSAAELVNEGTLAFESGEAHVLGHVSNRPGGEMHLVPTANVWLHGRVQNEGVIEVPAGAAVHLRGLSGNGCSGGGTAELAGDVSPGPGTAQMVFDGDVVFGPFCTTYIELGEEPGKLQPEHDRILVGGDLVLDGLLEVRPTFFRPLRLTPGDRFEIIDVAGMATGEFHGLGEGAEVDVFGGVPLHITYVGGDGNDIELYAVPEPAALCLLALGAAALLRNRGRYPISARCTGQREQADRPK